MDNCPKCEFGAIGCYIPSVNATELLQSGFSSLDVCQASILTDIENFERELRLLDPLFLKLKDRRDKLVKDLDCCKALLAPIRRLPRETLLQIFDLSSDNSPNYNEAPWILGEVCSTWRSISRSCPSLWKRIHISESYSSGRTFLETYIRFSHGQPIHLSVNPYIIGKTISGLLVHSEQLGSLTLKMSRHDLSDSFALASSPALRLTKLSISLQGADEPEIDQAVLTNIFSLSPITEAQLKRITYSAIPINMSQLRKFSVYSYDPAELRSMLEQALYLTDFVVTMGRAPRSFVATSISPITHADMHYYTSLQQLSFVVTLENALRTEKVPLIFDAISLPSLQQFHILAEKDQPLFGVQLATFEPHEYSHIVDLFHRSECNLTVITLNVPVSVEAFLVPILAQSPGLRKLDICVNALIARDVFEVLTLKQGMAQNLKELRVVESPVRTARSGILEEPEGFYSMVASRSCEDGRLEKLSVSLMPWWSDGPVGLPVAQDSPFRNLFRIKEKGVYIELLLDRKDCLVDSEACVKFFGPD